MWRRTARSGGGPRGAPVIYSAGGGTQACNSVGRQVAPVTQTTRVAGETFPAHQVGALRGLGYLAIQLVLVVDGVGGGCGTRAAFLRGVFKARTWTAVGSLGEFGFWPPPRHGSLRASSSRATRHPPSRPAAGPTRLPYFPLRLSLRSGRHASCVGTPNGRQTGAVSVALTP